VKPILGPDDKLFPGLVQILKENLGGVAVVVAPGVNNLVYNSTAKLTQL
jgi:hypothetical protein